MHACMHVHANSKGKAKSIHPFRPVKMLVIKMLVIKMLVIKMLVIKMLVIKMLIMSRDPFTRVWQPLGGSR